MNKKNIDIEDIGYSLIEHARESASTRQGVVDELFPYIVQAAKKISARGVSRFLEEEHGVKVSYVTIGRALRNPGKYWNRYFDSIEVEARIVAGAHGKTLKDFISEPEKYQEMMESKPEYQVEDADDRDAILTAMNAYKGSVKTLDEKWFCFDEEILEEARIHLCRRILNYPATRTDEPAD